MGAADPVVETVAGRVRGRVERNGRVAVWRGVPFAAPPVGTRRFAAPSPVEPWAGVRDAAEHGRVAVQPPRLRPGPLKVWLGARRSRSEDCLNLAVWAPATRADALRPVVVWIHGGSFLTGTGSLFDPSELVVDGEVVVVTINYRLGVFGFVDFHDALGEDERVVANAGLLDQRAALEWVQDNIAAFGGDPARVTVAGESAGSASVALQLAAPGSRGLMRGAICQSGALTLAATRDDAARSARQILNELGISRERSAELWRMPASRLLGAGLAAQRRRSGSLVTRPWFDGDVLPASLAAAYDAATGTSGGAGASAGTSGVGAHPVKVLVGSNLHEHRTFTKTRADVLPLSRAALATSMVESFGWDDAQAILREYPDTRDGLNDLGSDFVFRLPGVHLAERTDAAGGAAWVYRVDYGRGRLGLGAYHAIELNFLFGEMHGGQRWLVGPDAAEVDGVAARFRGAWLNFVRDGDPNGATGTSGTAGTSASETAHVGWPAYAAPDRATRVFDAADRLDHDPESARRRAWAGRDAVVH